MAKKEIGKQIDITGLVEQFEASEGDVEHIIGKTGQGKTYEATRRALRYLEQGNVVYTTWRLNLPEYFDERDSFAHALKNLILFRKNFFRFEYQKNWHFVDLDTYLDKDGIFDTERFARFLASRTDCIFMLDEGQDTFDSHQRAGKIARQSITRTRHMHKKLIIISQRAQAVDVNARGNVTWFYKCVAIRIWFLPTWFRVYVTDEIDENNNHPLWVRHDSQGREIWKAPVYHSGFARKKIYNAYDSWYMRKNMIKSQDIHVKAYYVGFFGRIRLVWRTFWSKEVNNDLEPQKAKFIHSVDNSINENKVKLPNEHRIISISPGAESRRGKIYTPIPTHKITDEILGKQKRKSKARKQSMDVRQQTGKKISLERSICNELEKNKSKQNV